MKIKHILLIAIIFFSCKVTLTPSYNANAVFKVDAASKSSDALYDNMIASSDKKFTTYADNYAGIDAQIHDILVLDSSRNKSKIILIIANDIKNRFSKYEKAHQVAGTLNNSELRTYKDYMHALFESLHNTEINFK